MALTKVRGSLIDMADLDLSNVGALQVDSIAGDADSNTSITFSGSDVITIATGGSGRLTIGDGALSPVSDSQIDLGTSNLEFKDIMQFDTKNRKNLVSTWKKKSNRKNLMRELNEYFLQCLNFLY